jgi:hypothetical protein
MDASRLPILMAALKQLNKDKTGSKFAVPKKGTVDFANLLSLISKEEKKEKKKKPVVPKEKKVEVVKSDLQYELSKEGVSQYKGLSENHRKLISRLSKYITPPEEPSLERQAKDILSELLSIISVVKEYRFDIISLELATHLISVLKELIKRRPDLDNQKEIKKAVVAIKQIEKFISRI